MEKTRPPKITLSETTRKVAKALGESESTPLNTIERLVKVVGDERVLELLAETAVFTESGAPPAVFKYTFRAKAGK